MEPHSTFDSEPLDQVISETLRERMGPPPSREVWSRIAKDIAKPPRRSTLETLLGLFHTPVAQSALIVAMLVVIVVQPAFYWINKDYPVTTIVLPYSSPRTRPIPEGEMRLNAPMIGERRGEPTETISSLPAVLPPVEAR